MTKRNQSNIEALIEKIVWPGAGKDPAQITMIKPFEDDTPKRSWECAGTAIKVWFGSGFEILLSGDMIDDALESGDCQPLIERVKAAPTPRCCA
ncbi:MAG TPA: hypothetical protein VLE23_04085 [Geminicoccaceae bacterium]|nr:hypothetical protein [Geminicoccaceae bacterium]